MISGLKRCIVSVIYNPLQCPRRHSCIETQLGPRSLELQRAFLAQEFKGPLPRKRGHKGGSEGSRGDLYGGDGAQPLVSLGQVSG